MNPGSAPTGGGGTGGPIWLVRHAPTAWTGVRWCGRSDPVLTPVGRLAAEALAAELASDLVSAPGDEHATVAVILASPLRRALETADAIGLMIGTRVRVEPDLAEVDFGAVDGLTWDELVLAHPAVSELILAGAEVDWPGGETAVEVARRAGSAVRLIAIASAGPVIAVSHGGLLREIARRLHPLDPGADSPFEPASARRLDFVGGRWVAAVAERSVATG